MDYEASNKADDYSGWSYGRLLKYISILESGREHDPSQVREDRIASATEERESRLAAENGMRRGRSRGMSR